MAGSDTPFPLSEMMTQGFEQTRKAMESYFDFFEKNIKAAPWLDTHLSEKMKTFTEQNIAAASEFAQRASKARISKTSGGFRQSLCKRNGRLSLSRRKSYRRQRLKVRRM